MSVYTPATDPFFIGDPHTPISQYVPSVHKPTVGDCCSSAGQDIDYEFTTKHLCETLSDGSEINFTRMIKSERNSSTGQVTTSVENVLDDMTTPYNVVDESNVSIRPEKCNDEVEAGNKTTWSNF